MAEPARPYTDEQLESDAVSKKDLVQWLQANGSMNFLSEKKLKGQLKNIAKTKSKDALIADYTALFDTKAFKQEGEEAEAAASAAAADKARMEKLAEKTEKLGIAEASKDVPEVVRYKKVTTKKGDKTNFAKKGDTAAVWYKGMFTDGKVFDTNIVTGRKAKSAQPLRFKVGCGRVIKGWDEVIQTMSVGEKIEVTIEPEWGYGRKGADGTRIRNVSLSRIHLELPGVTCPTLPEVQSGTLSARDGRFMDTVTLRCHLGYIMSGPRNVICLSNGTWTSPIGQCLKPKHDYIVQWFIIAVIGSTVFVITCVLVQVISTIRIKGQMMSCVNEDGMDRKVGRPAGMSCCKHAPNSANQLLEECPINIYDGIDPLDVAVLPEDPLPDQLAVIHFAVHTDRPVARLSGSQKPEMKPKPKNRRKIFPDYMDMNRASRKSRQNCRAED